MSELTPFSGKLDGPGGLVPFDGLADEEKSSVVRRYIADPLLTGAKGVIGAGEAVVGLADMPTLGGAGKALEQIGYRPKEAKGYLESLYSPEQQAANKAVEEASGFLPTAGAMITNPSTIAHGVIENLPTMFGSGAIGRKVVQAFPKVGTLAGAAIGEGLVTAGQNTEQVRQESQTGTLTPDQVALMAASGALTGVISGVSGGLAKKFGFQNLEEMIAGGKLAPGAPVRGPIARAAGGFLTEGVLEELPQSAQEQVAINLALGKPWDEGVGAAAAQGLLIGGFMGGAGNVAFGQRREAPPEPGAQPPVAPPEAAAPQGEAAAPVPPAVTPPPAAVTPPPTPAETMGIAAQPAPTPAERMGIDATAGPTQAAAAVAVDAGIPSAPAEGPTPEDIKAAEKATVEAAKAAEAATKEQEKSRQAAWSGLDRRLKLFATEAGDVATKAKESATEGAEPKIPAIHDALIAVSQTHWDAAAATRAMKTALEEKRTDIAYALVERAQRVAEEANQQKPSVPPESGMYGAMQKQLAKRAEAAQKVADKLAAMAKLQPETGNVDGQPAAPGQAIIGGPATEGGTGSQGQPVGGGPIPPQAPPVVGQGQDQQGNPPNVPRQEAPAAGQVGSAKKDSGYAESPGGYQTRIVQHIAGSNVLDPEADVGAFVVDVRKGPNDDKPLSLVLNKDGKLVTKKEVLNSDDKSNGTAWVPENQKQADAVRSILEERAKTVVGSPERTAINEKLAAAVKGNGDYETAGGGATGPQIEAENFKKPRHVVAGFPVAAENYEGQTRKSAPGVEPYWESKIQRAHYGHFDTGQPANDSTPQKNQKVDVFWKPGTTEDHSGPVFVIDQLGKDGKFDEHKVMLGYASQVEAVGAYKINYPASWKVGPVTQTTNEQLKEWLKTGDMTQRFSDRKADPLDTMIDYDKIEETDDKGEPTGRYATGKVPAREALSDIDNRLQFARAMRDCLGV